jgi:hypothetical protein
LGAACFGFLKRADFDFYSPLAAALATHRKASLATSDRDFTTVERKIAILWTNA